MSNKCTDNPTFGHESTKTREEDFDHCRTVDWKNAIESCTSAIATDPLQSRLFAVRAIACAMGGVSADAVGDVKRALELGHADPEHLLLFKRILGQDPLVALCAERIELARRTGVTSSFLEAARMQSLLDRDLDAFIVDTEELLGREIDPGEMLRYALDIAMALDASGLHPEAGLRYATAIGFLARIDVSDLHRNLEARFEHGMIQNALRRGEYCLVRRLLGKTSRCIDRVDRRLYTALVDRLENIDPEMMIGLDDMSFSDGSYRQFCLGCALTAFPASAADGAAHINSFIALHNGPDAKFVSMPWEAKVGMRLVPGGLRCGEE